MCYKTTASTCLFFDTWLNCLKYTNQPASYAHLLILPPFSSLCACTHLVRGLFLLLHHLSGTLSLAKLGHQACSHLSNHLWNLTLQAILLTVCVKLWALVYSILPSTTAVFTYTVGPWKLSANEQFFVDAQTSLLQTPQVTSDISFITDHVAYANSNKTIIVWNKNFFFKPGVDATHVYVRAWVLGCFHSLISNQTFWRVLTASVDSCLEIKRAPSVA